MPKMIISLDSVVLKEVQLTKDRTSLGRQPYNDSVIDNMAGIGVHQLNTAFKAPFAQSSYVSIAKFG